MRLINVLQAITKFRFETPPKKEEEAEVDRELILVRGMLEDIISDNDLEDDAQKEAAFENRLQEARDSDLNITNPYALDIIKKACEKSSVSLNLKAKNRNTK